MLTLSLSSFIQLMSYQSSLIACPPCPDLNPDHIEIDPTGLSEFTTDVRMLTGVCGVIAVRRTGREELSVLNIMYKK